MTNAPRFSNNASAHLKVAIAPSDTSIHVADGTGGRFPTLTESGDYFMLVLEDRRTNAFEIVKCTAHTVGNDIMTVVRAQEGTAALNFVEGADVSNRFTAGTLTTYFDYAYDKVTADARFLNTAGDTLTGPLLSHRANNVDPTSKQELVDKDYVDRVLAQVPQITISSAQSLVYTATAGQVNFPLSTLDIYGNSWTLDQVAIEPVDVYVAGLKKVLNNTGGTGDFTVNRALNRIELDVGASAGQFVGIDIFTPRASNVGVVTMNKLKPITPDGTTVAFTLRVNATNALIDAHANEDVEIFVNNVRQTPGDDYTCVGSTLTFVTAPAADAEVWGVWVKTAAA